ncbi:putative 3-demethylubiquinone-9 3-methyltransferase (glyoxalase superfamily) [Nocardia transvalensis]|uniref:Putative 3-demethylubiquinone-9 3-methyltransferase (Glyoxalase superfamily) n=1 Tax=Nocardia transvalensis TaxID=37333 RepID=A0A7W9UGH1_9NOCA|nr:VOC family protein [Nocardia transvalensis]MBB5912273.1 putative 3-demethylubiquinone-9 3-methyltransferase (glyoxalase superfamily) [Nocardia transvalensis]
MTSVNTFLWFDNDAEEAAEFYTAAVPDSRITDITRGPDGAVFVVSLDLAGHAVTLLNGGPGHSFTDATSIQVIVETQDEVDRLWAALTADGTPGPCGWLTDRYGLAWQVVPEPLTALLAGDRAAAVGAALRTMSKIDLKVLQDAHDRG